MESQEAHIGVTEEEVHCGITKKEEAHRGVKEKEEAHCGVTEEEVHCGVTEATGKNSNPVKNAQEAMEKHYEDTEIPPNPSPPNTRFNQDWVHPRPSLSKTQSTQDPVYS